MTVLVYVCMFLPDSNSRYRGLSKHSRPDIETSGVKALFYDQLLMLGTFGLYPKTIRLVIEAMEIRATDRILDLGAGTGKNELLMSRYLNGGSITALEIGREMRRQLRRRCGSIENIHLENRRIENPLPYNGQFDKVLLSFVLHGFEERRRRDILLNGYRALVPGGRLFVFDWNEFDLDCRGPVIRFFINHIECGPTRGFIRTNLRKLLLDCGFTDVEFTRYTRGLLRLASVKK